MALNTHFQEHRKLGNGSFWGDVENYCARIGRGGWNARMEAQLLPIHLVAYMLLPQNYSVVLTQRFAE